MSDINELREHLFDTLRGLKDGSINVDQARAVSDVAQVLIVEGNAPGAAHGGQHE